MSQRSNTEVVMAVLDAVERRDGAALRALYHPQIEFRWPPSLPYGGRFRGSAEVAGMAERFAAVWLPLQPTDEARRIERRVVAAGDDGHVVVEYVWKGVAPDGRRFQTDTLADYRVHDGLLARARMYYDDLVGLVDFLAHAAALAA